MKRPARKVPPEGFSFKADTDVRYMLFDAAKRGFKLTRLLNLAARQYLKQNGFRYKAT